MAVVKINAIEVPEGAGPELEKRFANRLHAVDGQPGFISFEQGFRAARQGRNPQTGETIQVAAANTVKVSAGAKLKAIAAGKEAPPA